MFDIKSQWIHVCRALPEANRKTLFIGPDTHDENKSCMWFGEYDSEQKVWLCVLGFTVSSESVTHWMFLEDAINNE